MSLLFFSYMIVGLLAYIVLYGRVYARRAEDARRELARKAKLEEELEMLRKLRSEKYKAVVEKFAAEWKCRVKAAGGGVISPDPPLEVTKEEFLLLSDAGVPLNRHSTMVFFGISVKVNP